MAKRISPARVGAFILAAIAIIVVAIMVLGGGDLFNTKDRCIIYFTDSVKGLFVGSAVTFRGVEVGRVASIGLIYNPQTNASLVPVVVDLEPGRVQGLPTDRFERSSGLQRMISRGLRAQLAPDSLLANTEIIQIDFFPAIPAVMQPNQTQYPQIPAIASTLQQLQTEINNAVQKLPELSKKLQKTVDAVNDVMSPANRQAFTQVLGNLATITTTVAQHHDELGDTITNLDRTSQNLAATMANLNKLMAEDREPLKNAIAHIDQLSQNTSKLAEQLDAVIAEDRAGLKEFSNGTLPQLGGLIGDTRRLIRRTDDTLDRLDRDPSRFLFGTNNTGIPAK